MKVLLENNTVASISCNQCGRSIEKNDFGYLEDHLCVTKTWGYGTTADGETHSFDLCFDCCSEMIDGFEIPVEVTAGMYETEAI